MLFLPSLLSAHPDGATPYWYPATYIYGFVEGCWKTVEEKLQSILDVKGKRPADYFHIKLGKIMWEYVGMSRNEKGLKTAIAEIQKLIAEGDMERAQAVLEEASSLGMDLSDQLGM